MAINNPTVLPNNTLCMLGSVDSVDLNDDVSSNTIYTVPVGKKCCLHHVRLRNITANCLSATCTIGESGALTDFLNTQTLSGLNTAVCSGILEPISNATTPKGIEYVAGDVLTFRVVAASGDGATCTVEFFGTLDDA